MSGRFFSGNAVIAIFSRHNKAYQTVTFTLGSARLVGWVYFRQSQTQINFNGFPRI